MEQKTFTFAEKNGIILSADLITGKEKTSQTIIYFHGGGLLYGSRHDLNDAYIGQFLENGFNVLLADYRLAPEVKLPDIYEDASDLILFFRHHAESLGLPDKEFILFGQSSGAFLALMLASDPMLPRPCAVLSFYGYSSVSAPWLKERNKYFNTFPLISESLKNAMIRQTPLTAGSVDTRYPLYVYSRQSGKWLDLVFGENYSKQDLEPFELDPERDFHFLPPVFLAHSFADEDVPIEESEKIKNGTLTSEFFTVRDLPHDFDTHTAGAEGRMAYDAAIRFLHDVQKKNQ
ncbi:alpha/beta hydrolase [Listeria aquatica]|uniref:Alpha/beta hydrolase n=1 Tax=Listeria aquatica TaxID=1494960 RepID=A0A841ZR25_9LIST|nr:alpha/beta hydrolase [Listeria aquatica]MBC1521977.1 alpha/beta hydrolase [Listeria aquatica]